MPNQIVAVSCCSTGLVSRRSDRLGTSGAEDWLSRLLNRNDEGPGGVISRMVEGAVQTATRNTLATAAFAAMLLLSSHAGGATVAWSPDHKLYAVDAPGAHVGKGQERERLVIFNEQGKQIAVAHVWLVEPDGTNRAGIRGCESWGWVDSARVFCEGTLNPSDGIYLLFDARSGRELRELIGRGFVWSPDRSRIADVGHARDLGTVSDNSDSIEIQGKVVFPSAKDARLHWFRSELVWSPDSRYIAVVDLHQKQELLYLVVVEVAGATYEHKLDWQEAAEDWPPDLDFSLRWEGQQIVVEHDGKTQTVPMAQ